MSIRTSLITASIVVVSFSSSVMADHSWNDYHWARTSSSMTLKVVDSTSAAWDAELTNSLTKWSQSKVLDLVVASSDDSSRARKRCQMVQGQMRVCNASYGQNGWLGLASIKLDSNGHITQGSAKMNDSYDWYWTPDEKNHVMCQEIGHVFGLGHTSTDGSSQKTCMDYSTDSNSQWPNSHDYQMLSSMYNHADSYNSYDDAGDTGGGNDKPCHGGPKHCSNGASSDFGLGHKVHSSGRHEMWVQLNADGTMTVHHVYLIPGSEHDEH